MYYSSTGLVIIVLVYLLFIGGYLLTRIMLALAVFHDAKAKANEQPLMWALLVGFLGWIPGIIYLCMRKNPDSKMIYCMKCGAMHKMSLPACPQCGEINPFAAQYHDPPCSGICQKGETVFIHCNCECGNFFPISHNILSSSGFCINLNLKRRILNAFIVAALPFLRLF